MRTGVVPAPGPSSQSSMSAGVELPIGVRMTEARAATECSEWSIRRRFRSGVPAAGAEVAQTTSRSGIGATARGQGSASPWARRRDASSLWSGDAVPADIDCAETSPQGIGRPSRRVLIQLHQCRAQNETGTTFTIAHFHDCVFGFADDRQPPTPGPFTNTGRGTHPCATRRSGAGATLSRPAPSPPTSSSGEVVEIQSHEMSLQLPAGHYTPAQRAARRHDRRAVRPSGVAHEGMSARGRYAGLATARPGSQSAAGRETASRPGPLRVRGPPPRLTSSRPRPLGPRFRGLGDVHFTASPSSASRARES